MSKPVVVLALVIAVGCDRADGKNPGTRETALGSLAAESGVAASTTSTASDAGDSAAAVAALDRMGKYLRTLKAFQVHATTTRDEVLTTGQRVQYSTTADLLARKPDRLRAEVTGDRKHRLFLYDGKDFTVFAGRMNYYATVPAPATIGELADQLERKYDIDLPLVDLFDWGSDRSHAHLITSAMDLGPSPIEGTTTQHYAFRQPGLDWEIWIQNGDYPLPRKLVLTTLTDDARPQYSAVLTWDLAPSFNDAAFVFDPPAGAHRILLASSTASDQVSKK